MLIPKDSIFWDFFLNIFLILCILESMYSNYTDDMELNKIYNENCLETIEIRAEIPELKPIDK